MILPDNCEDLIKLQRSNYDKKNIKKKYNKDIANEFNSMYPYLPKKCNSILDIGCGLAGISVQLYHYYNNPMLYLVDKDEISEDLKYGYSEIDSFYNSHKILNQILGLNGIKKFSILDPDDDFSEIENVDIVISLLAMGFHFPIYYYFGRIFKVISKNGILICDIRKSKYKEEISLIESEFESIKIINTDNPKTIRICAKGK